ncbi:heat shock factor binding protein 1-domain-containing protein [Ampelomyces quisqualis]|uniref:Heat shock factor binding protein 1-domain-containing protein n=1 Tax=Ampelomyces quisqualis TaxID=50730 RepID=A0A6A5QZW1_AMPQU|nr:heat shock factor binding protein 1-domain-containing protein [Ampelomyces quisqualis]
MATPRPQMDRPASEANSLNPNSDSSSELAAVVDDLLSQLNTKFSTISSELLAKMDDMSRRLDNLEANIQANDSGKGSDSEK